MQPTPTKPTILIVEDEEGPRNALKVILRPFYNIHMVDSGEAALLAFRQQTVDLVTLDLKLPDRHGVELLQEMKHQREDVEIIIITGYGSLKSSMDAIRYGAAGYLLKPFNVTELITLINQTLEKKQRLDCVRGFLATSRAEWATERDSATTWDQLSTRYFSLPQTKQAADPRFGAYTEYAPLLSDLLEAKSRALLQHSYRVTFYANLLAKAMKMRTAEQQMISIGSFLHDIGQIGVDELASDASSSDDGEAAKQHPEIGARLILPLRLPAEIGQIISYHHEWFDGSGYPNGLHGEGIPLYARIVCIAQAFDHLLTAHATHRGMSIEEASEQVRRQAGTHFDPYLAELFAREVNACKESLPALATSSL
ncbi:MAG: HD domain-containing phosphohydrolase [Nitrospiraceae bacterium]